VSGDCDTHWSGQTSNFTKMIIDTTVQPKAATHPTDAKLMHRARERLARLCRKLGDVLPRATNVTTNMR